MVTDHKGARRKGPDYSQSATATLVPVLNRPLVRKPERANHASDHWGFGDDVYAAARTRMVKDDSWMRAAAGRNAELWGECDMRARTKRSAQEMRVATSFHPTPNRFPTFLHFLPPVYEVNFHRATCSASSRGCSASQRANQPTSRVAESPVFLVQQTNLLPEKQVTKTSVNVLVRYCRDVWHILSPLRHTLRIYYTD